MKRLRNIISWILIFTLCCGEFVPAAAVYAADTEVTVEDQEELSDETAVSEDAPAVTSEDAVSEDEAVSRDEAVPEEAAEEDTASEDEVTVPEEEVTGPETPGEDGEEEMQSDYDDARCSSDVDAEEDIDVEDSYSELQFVMKVDQVEGRKVAASINKARDGRAIARFTYDNGLEEKACQRAAEAAIYYSNIRPDGSSFDTIYNSNVNAEGKARKEILIREGKNAAEAMQYFQSASANSLISTGYTYMAIGHVEFEGTHYWALELTNATTNLADRSAKKEDVKYTIKINDKFIKETGVSASLPNKSTIKVDTNVAKALPTFTGYIVSTEHKPEKAKLPIVCPAATWKIDKKYGTIANNKITAKCEEGTDFKIKAVQKCANHDYEYEYNVHVIVHVKSVSISVNASDSVTLSGNKTILKLDGSADFSVKVEPVDADDTSFTIKADNDNIVHVEKPKKEGEPWRARGASAGETNVWILPTDDYNKVKAAVRIEVEGVDEVCDPVVSSEYFVLEEPTDVRIYSATPDTDIYYLIFRCDVEWDEETGTAIENYPTEEDRIKSKAMYTPGKDTEENKYFTLYKDHVTISENCYLRAVAVKETFDKAGNASYKMSDHVMWWYTMWGKDWGEIAVIDQGQFESPEKVPNGIWIAQASMPEVKYNGGKITPDSFRVYYKNKALVNKKDYTVKFKDNINAGDKARAIFTFKGNYQGTLERNFTIQAREILDAQMTKSGVVYKGKPVVPKITLKYNGKTLKQDVDYKISTIQLHEEFGKLGEPVSVNEINAPGEYDLIVEGIGNFTGVSRRVFVVAADKKGLAAPEKLVNIAKVAVISNKADVTRAIDYTPTGWYPVPVIKAASDNSIVLQDGVDYMLTYKNCNKAGTATVIINGLESAGYKGKLSFKFKIKKVSLKSFSASSFYVEESAVYTKNGAKPLVSVFHKVDDEYFILKEGVDYTLSYKNNKSITNEKTKKMPTVVISGKGAYKDKTSAYEFKIEPADIGQLDGTVPDKVYVNKAGAYKSTPVIYDVNGKKLKAGTDYDKAIFYRYDENCYVNVVGSTKQVLRLAGEGVGDKDIPDAGTVLHASVKGIGNYTGYFRIRYKICQSDISKAKIIISDQLYTGKAIELKKSDIRFTKIAVGADDYEIVSYSNNTEVGVAKVVLRGIGNFGGVVTVKFNIKKDMLDKWIAGRKPIFAEE